MKGNSELRKHQAADTVKWIVAFVLIVAMIGAIICLALQVGGVVDFFKKDNAPAAEQTEAFGQAGGLLLDIPQIDFNDKSYISLSAVAMTAAESPYTKTVVATVATVEGDSLQPVINWKLEWLPESSRILEDVSSYVQHSASATSNGSILTLTCIKGFEGDYIAITAELEGSSFSKTILASFDGKPTSISVDLSSGAKNVTGDLYHAYIGNFDFPISLDNEIHCVGSKYYGELEMTLSQTFDTKKKNQIDYTYVFNPIPSFASYATNRTVFADIKIDNNSTVSCSYTESLSAEQGGSEAAGSFSITSFTMQLVDSTLNMKASASFDGERSQTSRAGTKHWTRGNTSYGSEYITVTLRVPGCNVSTSFKIKVVNEALGVTLDHNDIVF